MNQIDYVVDYDALIRCTELDGEQDWADAIEISNDLDEYIERVEYS